MFENQPIGNQLAAVAARLVSVVREWAVSAIVNRKAAVPVAADVASAVSAAVDPGAVSHVRQATADVANGPPAVVTAPKVRPITIKLRATVRTVDRVANTPIMPVDRTTTPSVAQIVAVRIVVAQNAVVLVALVEALTGLHEIGPIATTVAMRPVPPTSCSRSCSEASIA
jgi:hypothetical protein